MQGFRWLAMVALMGLSLTGAVAADEPEVKGEGSIYTQMFDTPGTSGNFGYVVDTQTRLCFVKWFSKGGSPSELLQIDCQTLMKRKEWKPILTWLF